MRIVPSSAPTPSSLRRAIRRAVCLAGCCLSVCPNQPTPFSLVPVALPGWTPLVSLSWIIQPPSRHCILPPALPGRNTACRANTFFLIYPDPPPHLVIAVSLCCRLVREDGQRLVKGGRALAPEDGSRNQCQRRHDGRPDDLDTWQDRPTRKLAGQACGQTSKRRHDRHPHRCRCQTGT
jgi:hypothetical protein